MIGDDKITKVSISIVTSPKKSGKSTQKSSEITCSIDINWLDCVCSHDFPWFPMIFSCFVSKSSDNSDRFGGGELLCWRQREPMLQLGSLAVVSAQLQTVALKICTYIYIYCSLLYYIVYIYIYVIMYAYISSYAYIYIYIDMYCLMLWYIRL